MRTKPCSATIAQGRLNNANQFITAAETIREFSNEDDEVADVYVTLCVHAGIAASDVICCSGLGEHPQGESHNDAIALLASADKDAAKKANRAAEALVEKARRSASS